MPVLVDAERPIVSTPEPDGFAEEWAAAWNRRDVEAVLTHFHDDVVFTSPVAAEIVPESAGVVHGKAALREYWCAALASCARPALRHRRRISRDVGTGDQLPQPEGRPGKRGARVRRRPGASRPRDISVEPLAGRRHPVGGLCCPKASRHRWRHGDRSAVRGDPRTTATPSMTIADSDAKARTAGLATRAHIECWSSRVLIGYLTMQHTCWWRSSCGYLTLQ